VTSRITRNTGNQERYTPARIIRLARIVMGGIDCDPATCDAAQETVQADTYYTAETNGLGREWVGRVWLNPPYQADLLRAFTRHLIHELHAGHCTEAILLTNNNTDTRAGQAIMRMCAAVCFTCGRLAFVGDDLHGTPGLQGQMIAYFGLQPLKFVQVFGEVGVCLIPSRVAQMGLFD
jgi:hypothetical protein